MYKVLESLMWNHKVWEPGAVVTLEDLKAEQIESLKQRKIIEELPEEPTPLRQPVSPKFAQPVVERKPQTRAGKK